ncbi:MAG: rhomboid family intramembrane serine protease [Desulfohalobiaceae bacterium]
MNRDSGPGELVDLTARMEEEQGVVEPASVAEWDLVLTAVGIPHTVRPERGRWRLMVRQEHLEGALEQIRAYERENIPEEPALLPQAQGDGQATVVAMLLLLGFSMVSDMHLSGFGYPVIPWKELGMVDAAAVRRGEWWRVVTGLTLHADAGHLFGNLVIGGYFIMALCRRVGSGLGWLLVIAGGGLGNWANVLIRGTPHLSLGASTAVFGALGMLGAVRVMEEQTKGLSRRLLPLGAGAALLAMLGTGGERTDLLAHLFGFVVGAALGAAAIATLGTRGLRRQRMQVACGTAAALLPVWCWYLALQQGVP